MANTDHTGVPGGLYDQPAEESFVQFETLMAPNPAVLAEDLRFQILKLVYNKIRGTIFQHGENVSDNMYKDIFLEVERLEEFVKNANAPHTSQK